MIAKFLDFLAVVAMVYWVGPVAFDHGHPIQQALAIALLAFMAKDLLIVEPEIYLVNGNDKGESE